MNSSGFEFSNGGDSIIRLTVEKLWLEIECLSTKAENSKLLPCERAISIELHASSVI